MPAYVHDFVGFKERSNVPVKLGIEIDFFPDEARKIREFIQKYPFDYAIGSVHVIGNWIFDEPSEMHEYLKRDTWQAMRTISTSLEARPALAFSMFWGIWTLSKSSGQDPRPIFRAFW